MAGEIAEIASKSRKADAENALLKFLEGRDKLSGGDWLGASALFSAGSNLVLFQVSP